VLFNIHASPSTRRIPPPFPAELWTIVELVISGPLNWDQIPPPLFPAELPAMVEFITNMEDVSVNQEMPPPRLLTELSVIEESTIVISPLE
jgi:hypothetical protein